MHSITQARRRIPIKVLPSVCQVSTPPPPGEYPLSVMVLTSRGVVLPGGAHSGAEPMWAVEGLRAVGDVMFP